MFIRYQSDHLGMVVKTDWVYLTLHCKNRPLGWFYRCQTTLTNIAIANLSVETSGVSALHLVALNGRINHGCCQSNLTKIVQSEVDLRNLPLSV